MTSDWEARQLFAQEALRAGVPLVATAVGGLPELVGDAAVLVPAGDVDAVDAAVARPARRPGPRAPSCGAAAPPGRRHWPAEQTTVDQVRAVYAERDPRTAAAGASTGDESPAGRRTVLVLLALAAFGGLAFPTGTPAAAQVARTADYVVIVGIPGLRWEDVEPRRPRRRCGASPSTARSARCRCARRCGRPARSTAG